MSINKRKKPSIDEIVDYTFLRGAAEFFPARFRILYGTEEFK
jgi:hypothetical protein